MRRIKKPSATRKGMKQPTRGVWFVAGYNVTELVMCLCMHVAELERAELEK